MSRYLHVEGVNFDQTLFDTSDISTIRGASRACEDIVSHFRDQIGEKAVLACGASKLIAKTELLFADLVAGLPEDLKTLAGQLHFARGAGASLAAAEAEARLSQLRSWTAPRPLTGAVPCALSKTQPAVVDIGKKGLVSRSVADRRDYGRQHRKAVAAQTAFDPAPDFETLIRLSDGDVPLSAQNKMAVVHADGAGFGAALVKLQQEKGAEAGLKSFSDRAQEMQAGIIAQAVIWAAGWSGDVLQFEVLLAGGDDLMFVLPAWKLFDFLAGFHDWTADEAIEGSAVHFRLGAIIADRSTPIRQMTGLAFEAVDALRASGLPGSLCSIDVFESAAPPMDGLSAHRQRLYGVGHDDAMQAWPLAEAADLAAVLRYLRTTEDKDVIRRSQIYRALRDLPDLSAAAAEVAKRLDHYTERTAKASALRLPGVASDNPALHLAVAAQLWDYCGEAA
ncbi:hypothetical protein FBT96_04095 [Rhodobacter capsulatus]|uniref:Cas10/Cmr2 second palm domain-containing protein n=1 Tax=Rhodobacter capsulatus TaxID=1061 RepID=A0A4U1JUV3_RHOCA|nr:hypothetical protein [Rhodobacter capsulatus]TKD23004.1 hypothetical protein FBT96_04095 [Rhodobacter capsulatus]